MDSVRFKEIIGAFLDSNDQFDTDKGQFVIQLGQEVISFTLTNVAGTLWVTEGIHKYTAEEWIIKRLAMVSLLAERILASVPKNEEFITPEADFLDDINRNASDQMAHAPDATKTVTDFLSRRPGGTCSVLYLTSDAGEGKTTLINHLARSQAEKYRNGTTDWLLVPVALGGRPFLRFDDVVVASLVNHLRFQRLYFDAFIHLVRMGVLIPALDGFEEIFVETSEAEAISSLGNLIRHLQGDGALLIAARKAYFEFRNLRSQARLLDSLPGVDVAFGRVSLRRWSRTEFVDYATLVGLDDPHGFYEQVCEVLEPSHPLLTRPVLVRRLVQLAIGAGTEFVAQLRPNANNYFAWLVDQLIAREAEEKWIDKHGEPPAPLLSKDEHHELLGYIAEEMWNSKTNVLGGEMLDSLAEIFCESKRKSPIVSRQVKERIRQHALIISSSQGGREFEFDHDDFRAFFLGEQLAKYISAGTDHEIRKLFRMETLPTVTLDSAVGMLAIDCEDSTSLIESILRVGLSESSSTFVRENSGAFITPLLRCKHSPDLQLKGLVFPPDSLNACSIEDVRFTDCYFRTTSLHSSNIKNCRFDACEFEHIGASPSTVKIERCVLDRTRIHSLSIEVRDNSTDYYDPEQIEIHTVRLGFSLGAKQLQLSTVAVQESDEDLRIAEKALQTFHRSTHVHEGTFKLRLSLNERRFFDDILPRLLKAGIIEELPGRDRQFRRAVTIVRIADALSACNGSFESFVRLAGRSVQP
jgi:hypothetical protein